MRIGERAWGHWWRNWWIKDGVRENGRWATLPAATPTTATGVIATIAATAIVARYSRTITAVA
jgi:hypothetical protein